MDLSQPFRGSHAIATGLVTPGALRGPRFRRLFRDIYVPSGARVDLELLSRAAYLLVDGYGALGGFSAAELLGAGRAPLGAPAEIVAPCRVRSHTGLLVRQDQIPPDELQVLDGLVLTTPQRTAYDLGRRTPLVEAVVAVDALAHVHGFDPHDVLVVGRRRLGARGSAQLPQVVELSDHRAGSPMESRIRLALRSGGLPLPVLQHPVGPYELDLAYPAVRVAIEYNDATTSTPTARCATWSARRTSRLQAGSSSGSARTSSCVVRTWWRPESAPASSPLPARQDYRWRPSRQHDRTVKHAAALHTALPHDSARSSDSRSTPALARQPQGACRVDQTSLIDPKSAPMRWQRPGRAARKDQPRTVSPTRWNSFRSE